MGFRIENLAEFSYGSAMRVVRDPYEIHEKIIKKIWKLCQASNANVLSKGDYKSLVTTIRKPCQALNTKALSKGDYESSVKFLDTKALSNVDCESPAF
jgi:hypothetical protein